MRKGSRLVSARSPELTAPSFLFGTDVSTDLISSLT